MNYIRRDISDFLNEFGFSLFSLELASWELLVIGGHERVFSFERSASYHIFLIIK